MPPGLSDIGRLIVLMGIVLVVVGLVVVFAGRLPWFGRLPGDIAIERDGFSCFIPIATMIVVSIVLTIVLNLIARILGR